MSGQIHVFYFARNQESTIVVKVSKIFDVLGFKSFLRNFLFVVLDSEHLQG